MQFSDIIRMENGLSIVQTVGGPLPTVADILGDSMIAYMTDLQLFLKI